MPRNHRINLSEGKRVLKEKTQEVHTDLHSSAWTTYIYGVGRELMGASHRFSTYISASSPSCHIGTTLGLVLSHNCLWVSCYYWRIVYTIFYSARCFSFESNRISFESVWKILIRSSLSSLLLFRIALLSPMYSITSVIW